MTQQEAVSDHIRDLIKRVRLLELEIDRCKHALMLFGQAGEDLEERVCALERKADTGIVVPVGVQPS